MGVYRYGFPDGDDAAFSVTPPDNILTIETIAAKRLRLKGVKCSGEDAANTPMRTRLSRDTVVGTGARTSLTAATDELAENAAEHFVVSAYATTDPTTADAVLFLRAWNSNGGGFDYEWGPGYGPQIYGAISMTLRQVTGAGTMAVELMIDE